MQDQIPEELPITHLIYWVSTFKPLFHDKIGTVSIREGPAFFKEDNPNNHPYCVWCTAEKPYAVFTLVYLNSFIISSYRMGISNNVDALLDCCGEDGA